MSDNPSCSALAAKRRTRAINRRSARHTLFGACFAPARRSEEVATRPLGGVKAFGPMTGTLCVFRRTRRSARKFSDMSQMLLPCAPEERTWSIPKELHSKRKFWISSMNFYKISPALSGQNCSIFWVEICFLNDATGDGLQQLSAQITHTTRRIADTRRAGYLPVASKTPAFDASRDEPGGRDTAKGVKRARLLGLLG